MKALIIDILNYSQLSQNDNSVEMTDLNVLLNQVLEDQEILIRERDARFEISTLPRIEVNPGQMRQVFQNLVSNALKFIRKGNPPVIQISARTTTSAVGEDDGHGDNYCYISFRDNGIGFDEKFADNIFTLFRRLHTKDKFEGTGIGLAITKKIVEKHGGHIIAKGVEGQGAEFIIILPVPQR